MSVNSAVHAGQVQTPEQVQIFDVGPKAVGKGHVAVSVNSESLMVLTHVWESGGEVGLHSHHSTSAAWIVLQGKVKFYGEGDTVMADLGRGGGVYIPKNTKYWFESTGDEPLIMSRTVAKVEGVFDDRVFF